MTYGKYLLMKKVDWDESGYHAITYVRESMQQAKAVERKYRKIEPNAETIIYAHEDDGSDPDGWWYRIYANDEGKWTKSKKIRLFDPEIRAHKLDYVHAFGKDYIKWIKKTEVDWPEEELDPESWIHRNDIAEQDFIIWMYKEGYLNE